ADVLPRRPARGRMETSRGAPGGSPPPIGHRSPYHHRSRRQGRKGLARTRQGRRLPHRRGNPDPGKPTRGKNPALRGVPDRRTGGNRPDPENPPRQRLPRLFSTEPLALSPAHPHERSTGRGFRNLGSAPSLAGDRRTLQLGAGKRRRPPTNPSGGF